MARQLAGGDAGEQHPHRLTVLCMGTRKGALPCQRYIRSAIRSCNLDEANVSSAGILASLVRWAILLFAVLYALTELDIAPNMIFILFACTASMIALAGGLAFGLGGRDTAAQIVSGWYSKGQQVAPQVAQAASRRGQSNGQQATADDAKAPRPQAGDEKAPRTIEFTAGEAANAAKHPR